MNKIIHTLHALACLCLVLAKGASSGSALDPKPDQGTDIDIHPIYPIFRELRALSQVSTQGPTCGKGLLGQRVEPSSDIVFSNLVTGFLSQVPCSFLEPGQKLPELPKEVPDEFKQWHRLTPAQQHDMYCRAGFSLKLNPEVSKVIQADPEFATASIIRLIYQKLGVNLDKEFMGLCGTVNQYNHFAEILLPIAQNSVLTIGHFFSRAQISLVLPDQKLCLTQLLIKADDGFYVFDLTSEHLARFTREISNSLGLEKECELSLADTRSVSGVDRFSRTARQLVLYSVTENGAFVVKITAPEARGVLTRVYKSLMTQTELEDYWGARFTYS